MDTTQVTEVADNATSNPGAADLERSREMKVLFIQDLSSSKTKVMMIPHLTGFSRDIRSGISREGWSESSTDLHIKTGQLEPQCYFLFTLTFYSQFL